MLISFKYLIPLTCLNFKYQNDELLVCDKKANECKFFSHLISLKVETAVYREDNDGEVEQIKKCYLNKWNCLEVNGEEVLPEYSYLSNIGKSSVLQSSYLGILSLCSTSYLPVVYLYLFAKCHLNSDVRIFS